MNSLNQQIEMLENKIRQMFEVRKKLEVEIEELNEKSRVKKRH
jgi:FtsZ-binding cell division protein ZapB